MNEIELKSCPFCGGEAEAKEGHVYMERAMRVRCTNGCVATKPFLIDHPAYTQRTFPHLDESTRYTAEQARQKAVDLWNRRADNG